MPMSPLSGPIQVVDGETKEMMRRVLKLLDKIDKKLGDVECMDEAKAAFLKSLDLDPNNIGGRSPHFSKGNNMLYLLLVLPGLLAAYFIFIRPVLKAIRDGGMVLRFGRRRLRLAVDRTSRHCAW
jgi:hypothetical protein